MHGGEGNAKINGKFLPDDGKLLYLYHSAPQLRAIGGREGRNCGRILLKTNLLR